MIDVHALTKSFGLRKALDAVDLYISEGEFVTLAGPNGAGKTTLLRVLATLSQPTIMPRFEIKSESGASTQEDNGTRVRIAGLDVHDAGPLVRPHIGFLSHRTLLYDDLTAVQNLTYYARLYAVPDAERRIADLLSRVGLTSRQHDLVRTYSRGMQQRLAVARVMLHAPALLLLDEPYTGLDPVAAEDLTNLLTDLAGEGRTIMLSTHNLNLGLAEGKRVVVLNQGCVVYDGLADATFPSRYRELIKSESPREPSRCKQGASLPPIDLPSPSPPSYFRSLWIIVTKDLAAELHTREIFSAMLVFAALAVLVFSFALDLRGTSAQAAAPGVLWATIVFAGTLGLSRALAHEYQTGGMEGLLLAPLDRSAIFFGKAWGNLILMLAVEFVLVPLVTVLFNVALFNRGVWLVLGLGTLGYALVGTLLASIAVNTRAREVMLPILLLPLIIPLLLAAVQATGGLLGGATWGDVAPWIRLLVVYNLVMAAVSVVTFDYVVEE